jgi:hypothetical protein
MSITTKGMLAVLSVSQWSARKLDKKETVELARKHGIAGDIASVNKDLLPHAASLDAIHKKTGEVRTFFYEQTLAWGIEGTRILLVDNYMEFTQAMRQKLLERERLVHTFMGEYPILRNSARVILNGMYRDEDYPPSSVVERKFAADLKFFPVPDASDWRVSLSGAESQRIRDELAAEITASTGEAMRDAWSRLHEVVTKAAEKLADPKAIFRDSLVTNALDLCKLLPKLNLTDDPNLEAMRQQVEGALAAHTIETLRQPGATRGETAAKMADIMAKMGGMYGQ